jgi:hypothetical protein
VIECPATESVDVAKVATPPLRVPLPIAVMPSTNDTFPDAVVGVTWAVKVTFVPKVDGFAEDVRVVVVVAWLTVCVSGAEVLVASLVSPA